MTKAASPHWEILCTISRTIRGGKLVIRGLTTDLSLLGGVLDWERYSWFQCVTHSTLYRNPNVCLHAHAQTTVAYFLFGLKIPTTEKTPHTSPYQPHGRYCLRPQWFGTFKKWAWRVGVMRGLGPTTLILRPRETGSSARM
jgi:hypothetical protein